MRDLTRKTPVSGDKWVEKGTNALGGGWKSTHQPSSSARIVVADALAGGRSLFYELEGTVKATPEEKKQRSFEVKARNTLNQAPGLPGVLR